MHNKAAISENIVFDNISAIISVSIPMFSGVKNQIKPFQFWANQFFGKIYKIKLNVQYIRIVIEHPVYLWWCMLPLQYWFDSILKQVTFNNIVTVINPSGVLIPAVCFFVASTKHCAWQDSCVASTHRCRTGCISAAQPHFIISNTPGGATQKKYGIILLYCPEVEWPVCLSFRPYEGHHDEDRFYQVLNPQASWDAS